METMNLFESLTAESHQVHISVKILFTAVKVLVQEYFPGLAILLNVCSKQKIQGFAIDVVLGGHVCFLH